MNKTEFTKIIQSKAGLDSLAKAQTACDSVLDVIAEVLTNGDTVTLTNFGSFKVVKREPRTGRNPRTGETIDIPASTTVKFTPSKALKDSL